MVKYKFFIDYKTESVYLVDAELESELIDYINCYDKNLWQGTDFKKYIISCPISSYSFYSPEID